MSGKKRAVSAADSSGLEFDADAEMEIFRKNPRIYKIQAEGTLRKQRLKILRLREEEETLFRTVQELESGSKKKAAIHSLLEEREKLDLHLEQSTSDHKTLRQQIKDQEKDLLKLKKAQVKASHGHQETSEAALKNELDQALISMNKQMTKNSHIRAEIETLLKQQAQFERLFKKQQKNLESICHEIEEVIDQSNAAHEEREVCRRKAILMKEKATRELVQHRADVTEMNRVLAHERRFREFMKVKGGEKVVFDERLESKNDVDQAKAKAGHDPLVNLEEVFHDAQQLTGQEDLDRLVSKFIQDEERNFALFKFVNDQNTEVDLLRDQIRQVESKLHQERCKNFQEKEEQQKQQQSVMDRLKHNEAHTRQYETHVADVNKILDRIDADLKNMFVKMDLRSLVEDSGIRDQNIMNSLILLDHNSSELLNIQEFLKSKEPKEVHSREPSDEGPIIPPLLDQDLDLPRRSELPSPSSRTLLEMKDELQLEEDRPLSRSELRQRIMMKATR